MSGAGSAVLDELSDIDAANVVRCARVLLRRPLLRVDGQEGELLPLVYRHRAALQDLFAGLLGYRLVVERRFARLYKTGPGEDPTRGEPGLSPRGYAYLALTMAALTGVGRQVLLSRLVSDVRAAAVEAGVEVADDLPDRRALTAALRHLLALGVITETEGVVAPWAGDGPTEALITIDTDLLGQLLVGPLAEADNADHLVELAARPGPRGTEHVVRRMLVENPVVLHADLPPDQAEWLRRRQRRESLLLERCFGLVAETRLEGIAITDPEEYLTDVAFPGAGTVARIALLALPDLLAAPAHDDDADADADAEESEPTPDGRHPVRLARVREVCAELVAAYPAAWSRQVTEDIDRLTTDVLALLAKLGLARRHRARHEDQRRSDQPLDGQVWLISPTAHRWLAVPDATPGREQPAAAPPAGWSLFDEPGPPAPAEDRTSAGSPQPEPRRDDEEEDE